MMRAPCGGSPCGRNSGGEPAGNSGGKPARGKPSGSGAAGGEPSGTARAEPSGGGTTGGDPSGTGIHRRRGHCLGTHKEATCNFFWVLQTFTESFSEPLLPSLFHWSLQAESAFQQLKTFFTSSPVLSVPYPSLQFIVEVDASDTGVGAVLSQRNRNDGRLYS